MNKEKILFIAYVACKAKKVLGGSNPDQYYSAITSISINFFNSFGANNNVDKAGFSFKEFQFPKRLFSYGWIFNTSILFV